MLLARLDARRRTKRPKGRAPKVPSGAYRFSHSPQPPHAVEMYMAIVMRKMAKRFAAAVWRVVKDKIADYAMPPPEDKTDAKDRLDVREGKSAAVLLKNMKSAADGSLNPGGINAATKEAGARVVAHSKSEFKRLGLKIAEEPTMTPLIDGWRRDTIDRIKGMQSDQLGKIRNVLEDGFGHRAETLSKEIQRQLVGVTESRADLIARDQVLTLNAKINRHRQQKAGIEKYAWTTCMDERVREEHADLEGEIFEWDGEGDPEEGHPGDAVNCRCVAFPLIDEDDDDEDEDD